MVPLHVFVAMQARMLRVLHQNHQEPERREVDKHLKHSEASCSVVLWQAVWRPALNLYLLHSQDFALWS